MTDDDFPVEIIQRLVMVTCPDNDHGGAKLPPGDGDDHKWREAAMLKNPQIEAINGPTISGSYVFLWNGTDLTDGQIKHRSRRIIKGLY